MSKEEKKKRMWIKPPMSASICNGCSRQDMEYMICGGCPEYEEYKKVGEPNRW